jgi:protein tyrosine/serine phosphatase
VKKKSPLRMIITIAIIAFAIILLINDFKITDFNVIQPGTLYTCGQPRGMDYTRLLYKYHIGTIINLRSPSEHREQNWYSEEINWVRNSGIKYIEMPLVREINNPLHYPDANMQEKFLSIMADKRNLPVLVHDGKGESRVAIMAAVWLAKNQQLPAGKIIAESLKIKEAPLDESEKNFIQNLTK